MAPVAAPDLSQTPAQLVAALEHARPGTTQLLKLTRFPFPLNTDAWDGYPAVRARVLDAFRRAGGNPIVVTGDSHAAWANELDDSHGRVGVDQGRVARRRRADRVADDLGEQDVLGRRRGDAGKFAGEKRRSRATKVLEICLA